MHRIVSRTVRALLVLLAAGCDSGQTTYPIPEPPGPSVLQNGLWTASGAPTALIRLATPQLSQSGAQDPATNLTTPSGELFTVAGLAFDSQGTLWIASRSDSLLLAFPPAALTSSGSRTAATILTPVNGSLSGPTGLAFDAQGGLWVANSRNGTVVRFDKSQLAAGGAQVPAVILSTPSHPVALAFDAAGTLWVSDNIAHTIIGYPANQLVTSGSPLPMLVLTEASGLLNPAGLAFDAAGNLWVANLTARNLLAFTPEQLRGAGALAPHIEISSNGGSLDVPFGLAFDGEGSLFVIGGAGTLTKFPKTSLGATGSPAPAAKLTVAGHALFWSVAFWPKPAGLPLR
jgi:sugar lactone lactonase YvrE